MDRRVVLVVLDGFGVGDAPDAKKFGTSGSNTLAHIAEWNNGLNLPVMESLGLGNIQPTLGISPVEDPIGSFGSMCEISNSVDSTSGHWEMMGVVVEESFPTYENGFPEEIINPFKEAINSNILGNKSASGTKIIEELGEEHIRTGNPIIYTSADSVFQIAAHEEIISVGKLYSFCEKARGILTGDHSVGRVIARPFVGEPGNFDRTHRRKDFTVEPFNKTILEDLSEAGKSVQGVGKINQIFSGKGLTESYKMTNNNEGIHKTIELIEKGEESGLIFTNLVDFDMKYGHRNDPYGYAKALEEWDHALDEILSVLHQSDVLIISADHGTDPTTESTDHSRELVPLLVYGPNINDGIDLGVRIGFHDIGQTILDYFDLPTRLNGRSFLSRLN